jgi:hypothetical protein
MQATRAMDILDQFFLHEQHILLFDNATTHTARAPDALSARKMPMKPSDKFWCTIKDNDGREKHVPMQDARFSDGSPQSLYFPPGHLLAGQFKGMRTLIQERREKGANLPDPMVGGKNGLKAQCKKFQCSPERTNCCCRRILFSEPDFSQVPSALEQHCEKRGYKVIFLPKFHCELNFIEQVWGYAKRLYRECPASLLEEDLENNALESLDAVPLISMHR